MQYLVVPKDALLTGKGGGGKRDDRWRDRGRGK